MLRLIERLPDGGPAEILLDGELDLAVADQLQDALDRIAPQWTLVDLSGVTFLDSTGIAVVLQANRRRRAGEGRVLLHSPTRSVLRVLTITGLSEDGLVFADRAEAIDALGG